jgi:phosphoserine aminotransferase
MLDAFPPGVPVVCDMSSNILSRKIDVSRYACIFAGAQKNIGPAGLTIVIIRKDILGKVSRPIPVMLDYSIAVKNDSLYNTPPTYGIYISGLVFEHLESEGGVEGAETRAREKSGLVYEAIKRRPDVFVCPVVKKYQSRMNIVFRMLKDGKPSEEAENEFIRLSEGLGMVQLKGHRSVGGIRASVYNALGIGMFLMVINLLESVRVLVELMDTFQLQ